MSERARPAAALAALGVALVAAVAGALVVLRAARHMPPLPTPAQQAAARDSVRRAAPRPAGPARTRPGRPEYPRLQ